MHGDQAVGPGADRPRGLLADGGAEQGRWFLRQAPHAGPVHADETVVGHLLAAQQRADDIDALEQAGVSVGLGRPRVAGDVLVERLAGAEGRPEAPREQLAERRDRLGDDRRVVALPGGRDDAEGQGGRLHRGAEPRPGVAGFALALAPGRQVIGAHRRLEAGRLGRLHGGEQPGRRDLLVRGVEPDDRHLPSVPIGAVLQSQVVPMGYPQRDRVWSTGPPCEQRR